MTIGCPHCGRVLEFSNETPSFCAFCGRALADPRLVATAEHAEATQTMAHATAPGPDGAPDQVAGYRLIRPLGRGGMGEVYEAEEVGSGRRVALKLIAPESFASREAFARFRQEGKLASTIAHPRCVFVLAADEEAGRPYIVMELMPGSTLQALVEEQGPLPAEQAITLVLDVIEGLREAHRLGIIHRDVKPSNCFREANGRVKVGDFGLSKSLTGDSDLTRSGAFLGTPLYASPEQIKRAPLDARTDVYSTAATLYFLLCGRAPFQGGDAASTLARIVSEPVPSLRLLRPEIPVALDRVVLRGLERDRDRRWHDLEKFRAELLPFLPRRSPIVGIGLRVVAYLIDLFAFVMLYLSGYVLVMWRLGLSWFDEGRESANARLEDVSGLIEPMALFLYYFLTEWALGTSPGKGSMRLRVRAAAGDYPPGPGPIALRTAFFVLLTALPWSFSGLSGLAAPGLWPVRWCLHAAHVAGFFLILSTMRPRNGYQGLHERLSGTRVVRLGWAPRRRLVRGRFPERPEWVTTRPEGMPEVIGPYKIRGALRWGTGSALTILLGEDPTLGREVWIELRPGSAPAPGPARQALARPTRLRWLNGRSLGPSRWDAFLAPAGCPLSELVRGTAGLPWHDVRPILGSLAAELAAASRDGTWPGTLSLDLVWIQPGGGVLLLDWPAAGPDTAPGEPAGAAAGDQDRALRLLHRVAALALQGHDVQGGARPIRAAVPLHAAQMLTRLGGGAAPYDSVEQVRADLEAAHELPTELDPIVRVAYPIAFVLLFLGKLFICLLALVTLKMLFPIFFNNAVARMTPWAAFRGAVVLLGIPASLWILWALVTRGGLGGPLLGVALLGPDCQPPSRGRCAWREALFWIPLVCLIAASNWLKTNLGVGPLWDPVILGVPAWVLAVAAHGWFFGGRLLHDRLSQVFAVPR